jgi:hypothetical protein
MVVWNIVAAALEWLILALLLFLVVFAYGFTRAGQVKREHGVSVPWYKALNYNGEVRK